MYRVSKILSIIILMFCFSSCDPGMVYDKFRHIDNASWKWEDPAEFDVEMNDTLDYQNIFIRIRHTVDYPLSNLYMFVHVTGPSGQRLTDTIDFKLAENNGKWIGSGLGKNREVDYLFKQNTRFPEAGNYHFSLEQAMRLKEVPVSEIGLRIEKVKP